MIPIEVCLGLAVGVLGIGATQVLQYSSKMDEYFIKAMQEKEEVSKILKLERWRGFGSAYRMGIIACVFSAAGLLTIICDYVFGQDVILYIGFALTVIAIPMIIAALYMAPKGSN